MVQDKSITIWQYTAICWTLFGGVLPIWIDAVSVFYYFSLLGWIIIISFSHQRKVIDTLTQEDVYGAFQKLLGRYNKRIAAGGDYFEGD